MAIPPNNRIDVILSTAGGFSGDGADAPAACNAIAEGDYTFDPGAGIVRLSRLNILIEDSPQVSKDKYGDAALTDGIVLSIKDSDDNVIHYFTPQPVKTINHWGLPAGPDLPETDQGIIIVRYTFWKGSRWIRMECNQGQYLSFELKEDATGLVQQLVHFQGEYQ